MAKIINTKTGEIIIKDSELYASGIVIYYLQQNDIDHNLFWSLSQLVKTMTGDAVTPFNTIGEMIVEIPEIVNCGEETHFLEVFSQTGVNFFILGWDYEHNEKLFTKIIQKVCGNADLQVINCD